MGSSPLPLAGLPVQPATWTGDMAGPCESIRMPPEKGMQWGYEPQGARTEVPPPLTFWDALITPPDTLGVSHSAAWRLP